MLATIRTKVAGAGAGGGDCGWGCASRGWSGGSGRVFGAVAAGV